MATRKITGPEWTALRKWLYSDDSLCEVTITNKGFAFLNNPPMILEDFGIKINQRHLDKVARMVEHRFRVAPIVVDKMQTC